MDQETNVFGITEPEKYTCFVASYKGNHSELEIVLKAGLEAATLSFRIGFVAVEYFEGPLSWDGANFYIGDPEECIRLLRLSSRHHRLSDSHLNEVYRLYYVRLSAHKDTQVRIVAGLAASCQPMQNGQL